MSHIEGVKSVDADMITQRATIVFDDTKTNFEKIKEALSRERVQVLGNPEYK